jgi:hypothetical protein
MIAGLIPARPVPRRSDFALSAGLSASEADKPCELRATAAARLGPGGRAGRDAVKTLLSGGQHALARSSAQIFAGRRSVSERYRDRSQLLGWAARPASGPSAQSVHDAGWSMLSNVLSYKSIATGGVMRVVAERYSSQTCSVCGCIPASSPKGWVRVK